MKREGNSLRQGLKNLVPISENSGIICPKKSAQAKVREFVGRVFCLLGPNTACPTIAFLSKVLPKSVRDGLVKDLDKRLDLDIDELLTSPKLELKLSPAELDKQCLELYDSVAEGPTGDLLRIIGGGNDVAMQHRYMKRKALKQLKEARSVNATAPFFVEESPDSADDKSASQLVKLAMRKNLPTNGTFALPTKPVQDDTNVQGGVSIPSKEGNNLRMSIPQRGPTLGNHRSQLGRGSWGGVPVLPPARWTSARNLSARRSSTRGLSLLI